MVSQNGSKQQLNLLSYDNDQDLQENDFLQWDLLNADLANKLISSKTAISEVKPTKLLTSPQDGLLEYDGTHLYFTIGTTRKTVTLA